MASPIANSFEGGTDTTTISAANSGGASGTAVTSVTVSGATTIKFSSAFSRATMGCQHAYAITQAGYLVWNFSPTATTTRTAWRFYIYIPTGQAVTSQQLFMVRSAAAYVALIAVDASGKLTVQNSAQAVQATASSALPNDTWVRVELAVAVGTTTGNGTIEAAYYLGDSTTPVQTLITSSVMNTGTVAIALVRVGSAGTVASARTHYYDDFSGAELASGFIGPNGSTVVAVAATGTGAAVAPAVSGGADLAALPGTGSGAAVAPTVTGGAVVVAVPATGSGLLIPPAVSAASGATVQAVAASGSGVLVPPAVTGSAVTLAVRAQGSGSLLAPTVAGSAQVTATPAAGSGLLTPPTVTAGSTVTAVRATGTATLMAPAVIVAVTFIAVTVTASTRWTAAASSTASAAATSARYTASAASTVLATALTKRWEGRLDLD